MLKLYSFGGHVFQFEDDKAPAGAVEIKPKAEPKTEPETKAKAPANKARSATTKKG